MTRYDPSFSRGLDRWNAAHDPGDDRRRCEICGEWSRDEGSEPRCDYHANDAEDIGEESE